MSHVEIQEHLAVTAAHCRGCQGQGAEKARELLVAEELDLWSKLELKGKELRDAQLEIEDASTSPNNECTGLCVQSES